MSPTNLKQIFLLFSFFYFLNNNAQTVMTLAGSTTGYANGIGVAAQFQSPIGIVIDAGGNVYIADRLNNRIRKITPAGVVSTFAGSGNFSFADGTGTLAKFFQPEGLAIDASGNLFVADTYNNRIRKITPSGVVTTLAGGTLGYADGMGAAAQFDLPCALTLDALGNIYVADTSNNRIRKVTAGGVVTTLAGSTAGYVDGTGTSALFHYPTGIAIDAIGNLYIADSHNDRIRKINIVGIVSTLAGSTYGYANGTGTSAQFATPYSIAIDTAGDLYVSDRDNNSIRKVSPTGVVSTFAGSTQGYTDGIGSAAQFSRPHGVALDSDGNIYVADTSNERIRKITTALSISNYYQNQISIYPIPASSIINIELGDITSAFCTIYNLDGRALQTETIINNKIAIDISNLSNGIYLMQITTKESMVSKKIVKR